MRYVNSYVSDVLEAVIEKYGWEIEFIQAAHEVLLSLGPIIERDPIYQKEKILENG